MHDEPTHQALEGLDDPELLAEIEAEFAELTSEIERLNAMPRASVPAKAELIKQMRKQWEDKAAKRTDRPEWRVRLDSAIGSAIEDVLKDGIRETADGRMEFNLQGDTVQQHGGPIMQALLEGFQELLQTKLAPKQEPGKPKAPPSPLQGLVSGLGAMLTQAIATANTKQAASGGSPGERPSASPGVKSTTTVSADQKLSTSLDFDTSKGDPLPAGVPEAFQSLVKGLGQVLSGAASGKVGEIISQVSAGAKGAKATPAAADPSATDDAAGVAADDAAQVTAGDAAEVAAATEAEPTSGASAKPAAATAPSEEASGMKVKVDFAGLLGSLFKVAPTPAPGSTTEADAPPGSSPQGPAAPGATGPPKGDDEG